MFFSFHPCSTIPGKPISLIRDQQRLDAAHPPPTSRERRSGVVSEDELKQRGMLAPLHREVKSGRQAGFLLFYDFPFLFQTSQKNSKETPGRKEEREGNAY